MEDKDIITLYWERSEEAIRATADKYGGYCAAIIRRVLGDGRDSEECLNDTWLGAWNAMPPQRPERLLQRRPEPERLRGGAGGAGGVRGRPAHGGGFQPQAAGGGHLGIPGRRLAGVPAGVFAAVLVLRLPPGDRRISPDPAGAKGQGKVKSLLHRARKGLRAYLIEEGYDL